MHEQIDSINLQARQLVARIKRGDVPAYGVLKALCETLDGYLEMHPPRPVRKQITHLPGTPLSARLAVERKQADEDALAERQRLRVHEAGHTTIGYLIGAKIEGVAANGTKGGVTTAHYDHLPLVRQVGFLLAGGAAEQVLCPQWATGPSDSDLAMAFSPLRKLYAEYSRTKKTPDRASAECIVDALAEVFRDGLVRQVVDKLTSRLGAKRGPLGNDCQLSADEVESAVYLVLHSREDPTAKYVGLPTRPTLGHASVHVAGLVDRAVMAAVAVDNFLG